MVELAKESFELSPEMLSIIAREFDIEQLVNRFSKAISGKKPVEIEKIAREIFGSYGVDWIRRSRELGEEYSDRTYELIKLAIKETGENTFPFLVERVLEIAYDGAHKLELLPVIVNTSNKFVYQIDDCKMFQALKQKCGEQVANSLPCAHACLTACRTIFDEMYPEVSIEMIASTPKDGRCQIAVSRP